jgi:hypothetical protein
VLFVNYLLNAQKLFVDKIGGDMRTCIYLFFVVVLVSSVYGQIDDSKREFPIRIVSADVVSVDSAFYYGPSHSRGIANNTRGGHHRKGVFDHFVYHVKVCFMLEMGKEWEEPFTLFAESPDGGAQKYIMNKDRDPLPDHNFFYFNVDVHSKTRGFARLRAFVFNEESDEIDYSQFYTSFYLP